MNLEYLFWSLIVLVLLIGGLIIGQKFWQPDETQTNENSFRYRLWYERSLDLAVQVGLIFCGALGIAALLPSPTEEQE